MPRMLAASSASLLLLMMMMMISCVSAADDVFLQFYMDQVKLWDQQGQQGKLQAAILPGLQAYCGKAANLATCRLNATSDANFTASNIVISPGYPVNFNIRYMNVRFKISYTAGLTTVTLPVSVVTEITQSMSEAISSQVGYHLFYINDVMYSPPPPVMANKVIVPMFVLGTLVLIVVALVLKHSHSRELRMKLQKLEAEMPSQSKNYRSGGGGGGGGGAGSNKVGASTDSLAHARKEKSDTEVADKKKQKKPKKESKSGGGKRGKRQGAGGKAGNGDFNNIGFDKSINEGDPRTRQSEAATDSTGGDQRASQSALSDVIQVRSDSSPKTGDQSGKKAKSSKATPGTRGKHQSSGSQDGGVPDKSIKKSSRGEKKDAEEVMLMDAGVFTPPEVNVTGEQSGSDGDDDVPTLRDSSDQQMI